MDESITQVSHSAKRERENGRERPGVEPLEVEFVRKKEGDEWESIVSHALFLT